MAFLEQDFESNYQRTLRDIRRNGGVPLPGSGTEVLSFDVTSSCFGGGKIHGLITSTSETQNLMKGEEQGTWQVNHYTT